jgi:peptidoglycan-N-acetylglucosamine deacetylase
MRYRRLLAFLLLIPTVAFAQPQPGDFITSGPKGAKRIALTFDDGPGPHTDQYLALLDKYGVKATFFMLAEQVKFRPKAAKAVADRGHEIASHTFNHLHYGKVYKAALAKDPASPEKAVTEARGALVADMVKSRKIIEDATGARLTLLRMPHGVDRPWIKDAARETGFVLVNWTYGGDWIKTPLPQAQKDYVDAIKPGAILLLHDGGAKREQSLALTEAVLKAAKEGGYEIVTLGELIATTTARR